MVKTLKQIEKELINIDVKYTLFDKEYSINSVNQKYKDLSIKKRYLSNVHEKTLYSFNVCIKYISDSLATLSKSLDLPKFELNTTKFKK